MRLSYQKGILLVEILVTLTLVIVGMMSLLNALSTISLNEKIKKFKIEIQEAIVTAIRLVTITKETLAFCLGDKNKCFTKSPKNGFIFTDDYHDGTIHNTSQIKKVIAFAPVSGQLFYRSFPYYRESLVFKANSWIESDNGTFWFCKSKQNKPSWGFSVNRFATIQNLKQNKKGELIDSKGKPLIC